MYTCIDMQMGLSSSVRVYLITRIHCAFRPGADWPKDPKAKRVAEALLSDMSGSKSKPLAERQKAHILLYIYIYIYGGVPFVLHSKYEPAIQETPPA